MESTHAAINGARATLCALRTIRSAVNAEAVDAYVILPEMVPLSENETVSRLAQLPKPLACIGLAMGSVLAVACWPESALTTSFKARQPFLAAIHAQNSTDRRDLGVKFNCHPAELILTSEEFDAWYRSYDLLFTDFVVDLVHEARDEARVIRFSQTRVGGLSGQEKISLGN